MSLRDATDRFTSLALSRRAFLERAGLLTGGLLALGPGGLLRAQPARAQLEKAMTRPLAAGSYLLTLNGQSAGPVQSFEGGTVRGQVIQQAGGPLGGIKKQLGERLYEPIRFRAGVGNMTQPFWELVRSALEGRQQRVQGAVVTSDFRGAATQQVEFFDALVSELTFPGVDAAAKEPAYIEVTLTPELTRSSDAKGSKPSADLLKAQKALLMNFQLSIDGLEDACKRINKVEAMTVKQGVTQDRVGTTRDFLKEPGKLEFPNLVFTVPLADAKPFQEWHKSFVIDGKNSDSDEKSGTLSFLTPNLGSSLLTLKFSQLGMIALAPVPAESGAEKAGRLQAELYFESMGLEVPSAAPKV